MSYSLSEELHQARTSLTNLRRAQLEGHRPASEPFVISDATQRVRDLESMEASTRFMAATRSALEFQDLSVVPLPKILGELTDHINLIRPNHPYVADHRERQLALFRAYPSINSLRAIWIMKP